MNLYYYCDTIDLNGFDTGITSVASAPNYSVMASGARGVGNNIDPTIGSDIIQIGEIVDISQWNGTTASIDCFWDPDPPLAFGPTVNAFILFSKDNKANLSSPLGYYASVKLTNDSTTEAEMHAVGMDIFASSA